MLLYTKIVKTVNPEGRTRINEPRNVGLGWEFWFRVIGNHEILVGGFTSCHYRIIRSLPCQTVYKGRGREHEVRPKLPPA